MVDYLRDEREIDMREKERDMKRDKLRRKGMIMELNRSLFSHASKELREREREREVKLVKRKESTREITRSKRRHFVCFPLERWLIYFSWSR